MKLFDILPLVQIIFQELSWIMISVCLWQFQSEGCSSIRLESGHVLLTRRCWVLWLLYCAMTLCVRTVKLFFMLHRAWQIKLLFSSSLFKVPAHAHKHHMPVSEAWFTFSNYNRNTWSDETSVGNLNWKYAGRNLDWRILTVCLFELRCDRIFFI